MSQPACLNKALAGNKQALTELAGFCYPVVLKYLVRLTGNQEMALELTQDTMVRILESLETYKPRIDSAFQAWILRIARNRFIDCTRRKHNHVPLCEDGDNEIQMGYDSTILAAIDSIETAILEQALMRLTPQDRELLQLRYSLGFSHKEAAAVIGIRPVIVKSRLNAALTRLRRHYHNLEKENVHVKAIDSSK